MKTQTILKTIFLMLLSGGMSLSAQTLNDQPTDDNTTNADISPAQGDVLSVNSASNNIFTANWAPGASWVPGRSTTYQNQHPIAYIWQLSRSEGFDTILVSQEVANTFNYVTTSAAMDSILQRGGVKMNDTVTLYHRVVASEGNWYNTGQAISIKVVRNGNMLEVNPINSATLAPMPAHEQTYLNLDVSEPFNGSMTVRNSAGMVMSSRAMHITAVGQTRIEIDMSTFERGMYFVSVVQDEKNVALLKLIKM